MAKKQIPPTTKNMLKKSIGQHEQPTSSEHEKICWSFTILDYHGNHGWKDISFGGHKEQIFEKLACLETMSWAEIKNAKKQHHPVSREKLSKQAQQRLMELKQDDIDELFSLRLSGKERVYGVRDQRVLKLLWWDPNHEIYPSKKKHT